MKKIKRCSVSDLGNELMVPRREGWGEGIVRECGMDTIIFIQINFEAK